jgi:hypothetical protein
MGDGDSRENSRRSKRIFIERRVRWIKRSGYAESVTGDINAQGMFIQTTEAPTIGTLHRVEVDLPDGPLALLVVVKFVGCGVSGSGVGVEIHASDAEAQQRWVDHYESVHSRLKATSRQ